MHSECQFRLALLKEIPKPHSCAAIGRRGCSTASARPWRRCQGGARRPRTSPAGHVVCFLLHGIDGTGEQRMLSHAKQSPARDNTAQDGLPGYAGEMSAFHGAFEKELRSLLDLLPI